MYDTAPRSPWSLTPHENAMRRLRSEGGAPILSWAAGGHWYPKARLGRLVMHPRLRRRPLAALAQDDYDFGLLDAPLDAPADVSLVDVPVDVVADVMPDMTSTDWLAPVSQIF